VKWYRLAAEQGIADAQYNLDLLQEEEAKLERVSPLAMKIDKCETTVNRLNTWSETMDRAGNTSAETQRVFSSKLSKSNECARNLADRTGKKYSLSKDWFGSGYTLKKP